VKLKGSALIKPFSASISVFQSHTAFFFHLFFLLLLSVDFIPFIYSEENLYRSKKEKIKSNKRQERIRIEQGRRETYPSTSFRYVDIFRKRTILIHYGILRSVQKHRFPTSISKFLS